MMTIFLIHGAWHGAWAWTSLIPHLNENLIKIFALNMPGRRSPFTAKGQRIGLKHYIKAIEHVIDSISGPIVLIGHSFGGVIISQVAENRAARIHKLIYISGFVPLSGERMVDMTTSLISNSIASELNFNSKTNCINIRKSIATQNMLYNALDECSRREKGGMLTTEPLGAFITPVQLSESKFGNLNKTYIHCMHDRVLSYSDQLIMVNKANFKTTLKLQSDHCPFYSMPKKLAQLIKDTCLN